MVMTTTPTALAPAASTTGGRPTSPGRRRPGEFGTGSRKFTPRRKVCQFCVDKINEVDYKDLVRLRRFLSERGKIEPRRKTGTCAAHQRSLNVALKRARQLALLPFTAEHIRVTGVLVREPGAPPFRGARPRTPEVDGAAESPDGAATPAEAVATPAEPAATSAEGVATPAESVAAPAQPPATSAEPPAAPAEPAPETPQAAAESSSVQGVGETPATGPGANEA